MRGLGAVRQDATVDLRMERFDAAVENLGEAGGVRDPGHRDVVVGEASEGAASREQLVAEVREAAAERFDAGLVEHGQQGALFLGH